MRSTPFLCCGLALSLLVTACPDDGERAACLEPPWVARSGSNTVTCESNRAFGVILPGKSAPNDGDVFKFLERHRSEIHALDGVVSTGMGLCCDGGEWPDPKACIVVGLLLCKQPAAELFSLFEELQASSSDSRDLAYQISFELTGELGPRLEVGEDRGPQPYDKNNTATPPETRKLVYPATTGGPTCTRDGECEITGCGNGCDHWTNTGLPGTCEGRGELSDAFCGCAEQQCAWFH